MPNLAAIVLAAGSSSRLGRPKQLLQVEGQTLLTRTVRTAHQAGCKRIAVVVGAKSDLMIAELSGQPVEIVLHMNWERGIGSSIRAGIDHLLSGGDVDGVYVLLSDQPHVSSNILRRLSEALELTRKPVAAAAFAGTLGPPVLVTGEFVSTLASLKDEQGAKSIWINNPEAVAPVGCAEAAIDIDTAEDLALLHAP